MHPLVAIVYYSLVFIWSANGTESAINKVKAIVKCCPLVKYRIGICLQGSGIQNSVIRFCDMVSMIFIDPIHYFIAYHTDFWNRSPKDWDHVRVVTGVCKPLQKYAKPFHSVKVFPAWLHLKTRGI